LLTEDKKYFTGAMKAPPLFLFFSHEEMAK